MTKKKSKPSQKDLVAQYLIDEGSITSAEAISHFWATRLSAIIYTLKAEGWLFKDTVVSAGKSGGNYKRYHLVARPIGYKSGV